LLASKLQGSPDKRKNDCKEFQRGGESGRGWHHRKEFPKGLIIYNVTINQMERRRLMLTKIRRKLNKKGFTLIELMIVIAIIGILAAIAIPQFAAYRAKSYNSAAQSDLRNMLTVLEAYYADFQKYPSGG
jgi:type IV pilus assembly protein PilA